MMHRQATASTRVRLVAPIRAALYARVRRGMGQLAWRFLWFQKGSALAQWYRARTADARGGTRKTMIVALARKLLVTPWTMLRIPCPGWC